MENSSGVFGLLAAYFAGAPPPDPLQPTRTASQITATAIEPTSDEPGSQRLANNGRGFLGVRMAGSTWQVPGCRLLMAGSSFLLLASIAPMPSYTRPRPGDKPTELTGSCARHQENPAGWPIPPCRRIR